MRIRRQLTIKKQITRSDWDLLHDEGNAASEVLNDKRFVFIIGFFKDTQNYITDSIVKNKIRKVEEHHLIQDTLKKVFHFTKQEQLDEMSGKFQMIDDTIDFLKAKVELMKDWDKLDEYNKIEIIEDKKL